MRLNKSTSHAIRILIDCARAGGSLVKVADLSANLDITMQNVFKIVHILSRAELLAAVRGRNGGVRLARPPSEIRIGDVVRAMETTDIELEVEGDAGSTSRFAVNGVNRIFDNALEAFVAVLDRHTLADMIGKGEVGARRVATKAAAERKPQPPRAQVAAQRSRAAPRSAGK